MSNTPPKPYRAPVPFKGQIVLWYEDGVADDSRAIPALVVTPNHSSISIVVFKDLRVVEKTCVRYVEDPNTREEEKLQEGCWDFTTNDKARNPVPPPPTQAEYAKSLHEQVDKTIAKAK